MMKGMPGDKCDLFADAAAVIVDVGLRIETGGFEGFEPVAEAERHLGVEIYGSLHRK